MGSINKQILLGCLTANAEGRSLPNDGGTVANLRLVTRERYQEKGTGEWKDFADYHRVSVFGQLAEDARLLKEGTEVYVEGRTRTRKYQQNGQDRYVTEVVASVLFPTGGGQSARASGLPPAASAARSSAATSAPGTNVGDDDDAPY